VAPSYLASISLRLHEWVPHTLTVLPSIFIVALGMWAAERRVLEDLRSHRTLLRRAAVFGLAVTVLGGVPLALVGAGVVRVDASTLGFASYLHKISGMFGGAGYVGLLGLLAARVSSHASPMARRCSEALAALGERSLSGYLFQSLAWQIFLPAYAWALGSRVGTPLLTSLALAVVVWLSSVFAAAWLRRRSLRGPAEVVLRRLTYGRSLTRHRDEGLRDDGQRLPGPTRTLSERKEPVAAVPTETT
jgi:uncharacterized membrane protein YeiB